MTTAVFDQFNPGRTTSAYSTGMHALRTIGYSPCDNLVPSPEQLISEKERLLKSWISGFRMPDYPLKPSYPVGNADYTFSEMQFCQLYVTKYSLVRFAGQETFYNPFNCGGFGKGGNNRCCGRYFK